MKKVLLIMCVALTGWQSAHADDMARAARGHTINMCTTIFGDQTWACKDAQGSEKNRVLDSLGGYQTDAYGSRFPRGSYMQSCRNCNFEKVGGLYGEYVLTCNCDDGTGLSFPYATAKGDSLLSCAQRGAITNCAGVFKCDGCWNQPL